MPTIDITPVGLLAFVGAELFKMRIRELAAQCDTRRNFNRAMGKQIFPPLARCSMTAWPMTFCGRRVRFTEREGNMDRKKRDRRWHLLRMAKRVGLTFLPPDVARRVFRQMLRDGGASCGICGGKGKLVADHCHKRQRHRGRLCHHCNTSLGLMKDDPGRLRHAAMYLEEFESQFEE